MLLAMISLTHSVAHWWATHPGWVTFIYFLIALWVSLYTDRARSIIFAPIRIPASRLARYMEKDLDNQIEVLTYMHTDTFRLVHYLAFYLLHALFLAIQSTIFFSVVFVVTVYRDRPSQILPISLGLLFGGFAARLMRLQTTLGYLFNYDKSIAELEALRAKYR
jgi:hypothetical protein